MENEGSTCEICNEVVHNLEHNNTINHRFHFMKWAYNQNRKALLSDRHGVTVDVTPEQINNFNFDFYHIKGKYITKVTPEQLQLHNRSITYKCKIKNQRKDPIYVTNINLLHPYKYFKITHSHVFGEEQSSFLKLLPDALYSFKVTFNTDVLSSASYKIPLSCDLQTVDNKDCFTVIRTFLTIVDDQRTTDEVKTKSPFTSQQWKDVTTNKPSTKEVRYEDKYPIPGKYLKLLTYGLQRFDGMNEHDERNLIELSALVRQLTRENYSRFWHILLWLEERAQSLMLMKYNMEGVTMEIVHEDILILEVPGLAEKRPSVIVGDFIRIKLNGDHTAYKGFVCRVNDKTIEISHVDEELIDYLRENPGFPMDVAFVISRLSFERMHAAVDAIASGMVAKLFPPNTVNVGIHTTHQLHDTDYFNKSVSHNIDQKHAVSKILNMMHDFPYIVFGPPGTGKTVTIVEAILQIKKRTQKKILVCAPANAACDMLAEKLMPYCTKEELIRIHSSTRERTTITEKLMEYSNMEDDEFTKVDLKKLLTYRIVVTTLTLVGRFSKIYHPDSVFIDEAAQASEPETDIAISLANVGKQVVLAGDPKQLGPMTTKCAEKYGLGKSLLQRLMDFEIYSLNRRTRTYDNNFITMLRLNFRSHPDILLIPNELFYDNLLKPVSLAAQRDPIVDIAIYPFIKKKSVKGKAVEFCSISAKEQREGSSPSFFNLFEAKMVVKYVRALHNLNLPDAYRVRTDQIGVVTPYKRQVFKIKEGLKFNGFDGVEVGTTESFQGREKRIIIISTVRAQHSLLLHDKKYNLGFVTNDQRFNVAITRAISKLVVIGSPLVLRTDNKWAKYMDLCREYRTYFGNDLEDGNMHFKEEVLNRMRFFKHIDDQYNR